MITRKRFTVEPHFVATTAQTMAAISTGQTVQYVNAAVMATHNTIHQQRRVPALFSLASGALNKIYFIPTSIVTAVKLIVNTTTTLYLKVFGGSQ